MSWITQCPHCQTRFRIHQEQLDARHGLVCCGRCQHAFNAHVHLQQSVGETPSIASALGVPYPPPTIAQEDSSAKEERSLEASSVTQSATGQLFSNEEPKFGSKDAVTEFSGAAPPRVSWWTIIGIVVLGSALVAQAAYFFRADLAARFPPLRAPLSTLCHLASCTVGLPHQAELLTLEASGLEATDNHPEQIALTAQLQNRAKFTQDYPYLQLTLTNEHDSAMIRKVFRPEDYLSGRQNLESGLLAGQELDIRLELDIAGAKPVGYRLLLFYPK